MVQENPKVTYIVGLYASQNGVAAIQGIRWVHLHRWTSRGPGVCRFNYIVFQRSCKSPAVLLLYSYVWKSLKIKARPVSLFRQYPKDPTCIKQRGGHVVSTVFNLSTYTRNLFFQFISTKFNLYYIISGVSCWSFQRDWQSTRISDDRGLYGYMVYGVLQGQGTCMSQRLLKNWVSNV